VTGSGTNRAERGGQRLGTGIDVAQPTCEKPSDLDLRPSLGEAAASGHSVRSETVDVAENAAPRAQTELAVHESQTFDSSSKCRNGEGTKPILHSCSSIKRAEPFEIDSRRVVIVNCHQISFLGRGRAKAGRPKVKYKSFDAENNRCC